MTSSKTLKKLVSVGSALLLAIGGSLVATAPANATVNTHISGISVFRLNSATRAAAGSTYTANIGNSERISNFIYDENFPAMTAGGTLSLVFTLPAGVSIPYGSSISAYATTTTQVSPYYSGSTSSTPFTTETVNLSPDSGRTAVNVRTSFSLSGFSGSTLTIGVAATLGSTPVAPLSSASGVTNPGGGGMSYARGTAAVVNVTDASYTAVAGDQVISASSDYMGSCIWPGSSTASAGQSVVSSWSNGSGPAFSATASNAYYYAANSQTSSTLTGTAVGHETSFTVPNPAPQAIQMMSSGFITSFQPGDVIAPSVKFTLPSSSTDLLEPCLRTETLPAVTANASNGSVVLTLTPPTTSSHYSGWANVSVLACDNTITSCGSMGSYGMPQSSFRYMGMLSSSATTVTVNAQYMFASNMGMGMNQMPASWDPTAAYTYVVLYQPSSSTGYQGLTASTSAIVATVAAAVTSNPATPTISSGVATSTAATWSNADSNFHSYWLLCTSSHPAANGTSQSPRPSDCGPISATALNGSSATWINTNPWTITSATNKWVSCTSAGCTTSPVNTDGAYLTWYESDAGPWTMSATVLISSSSSSSSSSSNSSSSSSSSSAPVPVAPVWQAPVLNTVIGISRGVQTSGDKLSLSSSDLSGLQSVTIGGKSVAFTMDATTGKVTIPVPAANPGSVDLTLKFDSGSITVVNGITYVAPTNVATVVERPVAIAAGTKTLSTSVSDQVLQAVYSNMSNTNLQCYAYAASNTAAAKAAAAATAAQVCAFATKANPALKAAPVTVIVNKAKAKTSAVGIKVYH